MGAAISCQQGGQSRHQAIRILKSVSRREFTAISLPADDSAIVDTSPSWRASSVPRSAGLCPDPTTTPHHPRRQIPLGHPAAPRPCTPPRRDGPARPRDRQALPGSHNPHRTIPAARHPSPIRQHRQCNHRGVMPSDTLPLCIPIAVPGSLGWAGSHSHNIRSSCGETTSP